MVTVCLNAADTISATIDSVHLQCDLVHEYIIIDGGSTDGTLDIVAGYEDRFAGTFSWVSEPDTGIYDAMNKGIARATGTFVLFLGADDILLEGALAAMTDAMTASGEADLVFGDAHVVEPSGGRRLLRATTKRGFVAGVPRAMPVCHQACAFSARAYCGLGGFDTSFRIAGDYEFYLRFYEAGLQSRRISMPVVEYSLGGVSSRLGVATAREYRRARVLHGVSPFRASLAMIRSLINLALMRLIRRSSRFLSVRHAGPGRF